MGNFVRLVVACALLLHMGSAYAQIDSLYHRFTIGIHGSDDHYEFSFLEEFNNSNDFPAPISFLETPTYSIGSTFGVTLDPWWHMRTGIFYSTKGFKLKYNNDPLLTGVTLPERTISKAHYAEIPITISRYVWFRRDFSVYCSAGVAGSFFLNDEELSETEDDVLYSSNFLDFEYTPFLFRSEFAAGFRFHINRHFSALFEPYVRQYYRTLSDEIMATEPFGYGITMGLGIHMGE